MEQLCDREQLDIGRKGVRIPQGTTGGRLSSLYLDHGNGYINIWLCDKLHVPTYEPTAREEACMGHDPKVNFLVLVLYECYLKYKVLLRKTEQRVFRSSLRICQSKPEIISNQIIKAKHQIQVIGSSIFYFYIPLICLFLVFSDKFSPCSPGWSPALPALASWILESRFRHQGNQIPSQHEKKIIHLKAALTEWFIKNLARANEMVQEIQEPAFNHGSGCGKEQIPTSCLQQQQQRGCTRPHTLDK